MKRAHVFFTGRVQGVFFRANTQKKAIELGVNGWVKNLPDGRVEAVFEGDELRIKDIILWCSANQPYAVVDDVKIEWEEPEGLMGFEIRS